MLSKGSRVTRTLQVCCLRLSTTTEVLREDCEIGDAVPMLHRIAKALDKQVEFRIVPLKTEPTEQQLRSESPQGGPIML